MKRTHTLFSLAALAAFAASTQASSLSVGFQATIGSEGNALAKRENDSISEGGPYYVSVHPNNPGYASFAANLPGSSDPAPAFQRPFTAPVQAWSWVGGGPNNVLTQDVRTDGSGLITYSTNSTAFDGFAQDQLTLWVTSDPGPDLLNPSTTRDFVGPGYRGGFVDVTASIDISGLASGTVYIFYGDFRGTPTVSAVMKDTSGVAPDITVAELHLNGDYANRAEYYVAELDFVNNGSYDVIEYVWNARGDGGTNGRFGGTVLTGVAPGPSGIQLIITPNGDNFDFTWDSQPDKVYDLVTSTDLATPILEWPVYDPDEGADSPYANIPATGTTTTLTDVPGDGPKRFFAMVEKDAP